MAFFDPKCKTCGKRAQKSSMIDEMCPLCCKRVAIYNELNKEYQEKTGQMLTDSIDAIVKMDGETMQRGFYKLLADNMPSCKACGETFSFSDLKEGYCSNCHAILLEYVKVRKLYQQMFGVTINLEPSDIVKMTDEEFKAAIAKQVPQPEKKKTIHGFEYEWSDGITLEALRDDFGTKRVRFATRLGPDCTCEECRKRNGLILPIEDAIALALHNTEHKGCGRWFPLRERNPSEDPDTWKKDYNPGPTTLEFKFGQTE